MQYLYNNEIVIILIIQFGNTHGVVFCMDVKAGKIIIKKQSKGGLGGRYQRQPGLNGNQILKVKENLSKL